jgi:hypothetical protein
VQRADESYCRPIAAYPLQEFVEAGGLMAYGRNVTALYRRTAGYVDRLLRGGQSAELPIVLPRPYELGFHGTGCPMALPYRTGQPATSPAHAAARMGPCTGMG